MKQDNEKYEVLDNGAVIGRYLYLDSGLALIRGYLEMYPENGVELTIKKMDNKVDGNIKI